MSEIKESDEEFVRKCSIKSIAGILPMFQPEDFDKIYIQVLKIYNKHYAPYAKLNNSKRSRERQLQQSDKES